MSEKNRGQESAVAGRQSDLVPDSHCNCLFSNLDHMSEQAANALGSDSIKISITQGKFLQTLGSFPAIGEDLAAREFRSSDTVCAQTIELEAPLNVEDARKNASLRDLTNVKNGQIVGYLGVPIAVAGYGIVGSLCAIAKEPRVWSPLEVRYLEQFSQTVSMCLLAGMSEVEQRHLSDDLSALDQIVATLAAELSVPTSIYSESGEMAFANAALTAIAPLDVVTGYCHNRRLRSDESGRIDGDTQTGTDWIMFESQSGAKTKCRVVCSASDSGLMVCNWYPSLSIVA